MPEAVAQGQARELPPEFKTFTRKNGTVAKIRQKPKPAAPAAAAPARKLEEKPEAPSSGGWVAPVVVGTLLGVGLLIAAVAVVKHSQRTQQSK
jgi:hypothetical protein